MEEQTEMDKILYGNRQVDVRDEDPDWPEAMKLPRPPKPGETPPVGSWWFVLLEQGLNVSAKYRQKIIRYEGDRPVIAAEYMGAVKTVQAPPRRYWRY
jgi:hypothetical protein